MRTVLLAPLAMGFVSSMAADTAIAQVGACCLGDGTCSDTDLAGCDLGPGEFLGEGSTCATTVCLGACCLADKACAEDNRDGCDAAVGTFQGAGTTCALHCAAKLPTVFTYQGQLKQTGVPLSGTADLEFSLWTTTKGGDQVGSTLLKDNVLVAGGLLAVPLDFGIDVFNGNARWLEIAVRSPHDPGDSEPFTTLSPRQLIAATPYALQTRGLFVDDVGNVQVEGWIGTADDQPVNVFVNGTRALRIEYAEFAPLFAPGPFPSPNVIFGSPSNSVTDGVAGATISGGGFNDGGITSAPNLVTGHFSTIGGGRGNRAGVDSASPFEGSFATVSGGAGNTATGFNSTVGGGRNNDATGTASTVAGGQNNEATGLRTTVGGGVSNKATGEKSTVPGGDGNVAGGDFSFAAGRRAKVRDITQAGIDPPCAVGGLCGDSGTFVWADAGVGNNGSDFFSTGRNQFLIRAVGGVGIGTNAPTNQLSVVGDVDISGRLGIGTTVPAALVEIQADQNVSEYLHLSGFDDDNASTRPVFKFLRARGSAAVPAIVANGDRLGSVLASAYDGTEFHIPASIEFLVDGAPGAGDMPGRIEFFTAPDGGTARVTRMTIKNDGNVGIGTTSPTAPLDVAGVIRSSGATGGLVSALNPNNQSAEMHMSWLNNVARIRVGGSGTGAQNGFDIQRQGDVSLMRLLHNGNVGIGTTAPITKLHVNGSIHTEGTDRDYSVPPGDAMQFGHLDGTTFTERMRLNSSGRLGIGRLPAANRLEIEGNASKSAAGNWIANSDRRIKKNVRVIDGALDKINKVRLVSFEYVDDYRVAHSGVDRRRYLNVIAQEFAEVFPEFVQASGERLPDGSQILQVDSYPLTIYAAAAIQELHEQMRSKDAEIEAMKEENAAIRARLQAMETMLAELAGRKTGSTR